MKRTTLVSAIALGLSIPTLAQEWDYQPLQPVQPIIPSFQLPAAPTYQLPAVPDYRINIPPVPTYQPRQRQIDPNDYGISRQEIERQWERQREADRGLRRSNLARCAKYNIHCVNLLRSLGGE